MSIVTMKYFSESPCFITYIILCTKELVLSVSLYGCMVGCLNDSSNVHIQIKTYPLR